jgi:uncharacterized protein
MQVVAGPRQVGKTTSVQQVLADTKLPSVHVSADEPALRDTAWLTAQWERARLAATGKRGAVLALDEAQKIPDWSGTVKRLWDEDSREREPLRVILLGSAPWLMQRGLSEPVPLTHGLPNLMPGSIEMPGKISMAALRAN